MSNFEHLRGYKIPFVVPHSPDILNMEWPRLNDTFKTNILLSQLYFTRAYTLGSSDPRTLTTKAQLEESESQLRSSGQYPFQISSAHGGLTDRLNSVIAQSFNFLDQDIPENYNTVSRRAKDSATTYTTRLTPSWHGYCAPDRNVRVLALAELNEPSMELVKNLTDVFMIRAEYMRKKAGSVQEYFKQKDGIDWTALLNNTGVTRTIEKFADLYSKKRRKHLGIDTFRPEDLYAPNFAAQTGRENNENTGAKDTTAAIRQFLVNLGLDEVSQQLLSVRSQRTGGYLIHLGHNWEPRPLIFMSDSSGRRRESIKYDIMGAHETGHAAAHYVGSRASLPLFSTNGVISEFPSILLETLFRSADNLEQLGYGKAAIEEASNLVPTMHHHLHSTELEYRLLQHAEDGTLNVETLGLERAQNLRKYYGVVHFNGENNHTWQFLLSRQMLHDPWFNMRSYVVGEAMTHATIQILKSVLVHEWIGSDSFKRKFSSLFQGLFANGPFVLLRDIEEQIGIRTENLILEKLKSDFELYRNSL